MKHFFTCIFFFSALLSFAQKPKEKGNLYSFFYNRVYDNYPYPLLGIVNWSKGNNFGVQIGAINIVQQNFSGIQIGGYNSVFIHNGGLQLGFLNSYIEGRAWQVGVINFGNPSYLRPQIGSLNVAISENYKGIQLGLACNIASNYSGVQIGQLNVAGIVRGVQLGFINFADSIETGVPISFLSFVKNGGYMAIEASGSNILPVAIAFKTGLHKLYSQVLVGYHDDFVYQTVMGWGMGSILPIYKTLAINPEYIIYRDIDSPESQSRMILLMLRWSLYQRMHLAIGPVISVTAEKLKNAVTLQNSTIEKGLRLAISYDLR